MQVLPLLFPLQPLPILIFLLLCEPLVYLQALHHLLHLRDLPLVVIPVRVRLSQAALGQETRQLLH